GLSYLHSLGIVHLDIKPENIFLTHNRHCVIGDFGGSVYRPGRILPGQEGVPSACRTYTTPGFCAPELSASYFHFHLDVMFDCRADFWSLGVTIFNMVVPD
ncbi:kinase-like domain-containing protein, partial [Flammula alnicola]